MIWLEKQGYKSMSANPYFAYVRSALLGMLAYRLRYFTGILTYLLYVGIHFFIWKAVFAGAEQGAGAATVINGFTLPEMITYIAVAWIARSLCFSNIDWDMDEIVRSGQVSIYLIRPVSFHLMMLSQGMGEFLFRLIFFTLPIALVVCFFFPVSLPANSLDALLFGFSTLCGFIAASEINFLVGLIAFYTKSISSIVQAKHYLLQLLSGLLLPLSFFPEWAEALLRLLPFQMITSLPLEFYLGKIPQDRILTLVLLQVLWIVVLHVLAMMAWKRTTAKVIIQGG